MQVEYSGWTQERGSFYCSIFIDEFKNDYELIYKNGAIAKQTTPFHTVTADWNHDGDVYEQFGAFFQCPELGGGSFWTPQDLVRAAADGLDKDRFFYDNEVVAVKGVKISPLEKRKNIDEMIIQSEKRSFHQEAERNSKMNALGIRSPGEPWAR